MLFRIIFNILSDEGITLEDNLISLATLSVFSFLIYSVVKPVDKTVPYDPFFFFVITMIFIVFIYLGYIIGINFQVDEADVYTADKTAILKIYANNSIEMLKVVVGIYTVVYPIYYFIVNAMIIGTAIRKTVLSIKISRHIGLDKTLKQALIFNLPIIISEFILYGIISGYTMYYSLVFMFYQYSAPLVSILRAYLIFQPLLLSIGYLEHYYMTHVTSSTI